LQHSWKRGSLLTPATNKNLQPFPTCKWQVDIICFSVLEGAAQKADKALSNGN